MTTKLLAPPNPLEGPIKNLIEWGQEALPEVIDLAQDPTNVVMAIAGVAIAGGSVAAAAHLGLKFGAKGINALKLKLDPRAGVIVMGRKVEGGRVQRAAKPPFTLSFADLCMHVQAVAPTRQGKTTLVIRWIEQHLKHGHCVPIVETSGDLGPEALEVAYDLGVPVCYLNPYDPSTDSWNPLAGDPEHVAEQMVGALEAVSPSSDPYYESQNGTIFRMLIRAAHAVGAATGKDPTLAQIFEWLTNEKEFLRDLEGEYSGQGQVELKLPTLDHITRTWLANEYFDWKPEERRKNKSALYSVLLQMLGRGSVYRVLTPEPGDEVVELSEALKRGGLILCRIPEQKVGEVPAMTLALMFLMRVMQELEDRDVRHPVALFLDELQYIFGKKGRSGDNPAARRFARWLPGIGKYGVAVHVAYQGYTQIPQELDDILESNATHKFMSGRQGFKDAGRVQKVLGSAEVTEQKITQNTNRKGLPTGRNIRTQTEPKFRKTIDEIRFLKRGLWHVQTATKGNLQEPFVMESLPPRKPAAPSRGAETGPDDASEKIGA